MISQCRAALPSNLGSGRQPLAQSRDVKSTSLGVHSKSDSKPVLLAQNHAGAENSPGDECLDVCWLPLRPPRPAGSAEASRGGRLTCAVPVNSAPLLEPAAVPLLAATSASR
jgi:hypothetical protein